MEHLGADSGAGKRPASLPQVAAVVSENDHQRRVQVVFYLFRKGRMDLDLVELTVRSPLTLSTQDQV